MRSIVLSGFMLAAAGMAQEADNVLFTQTFTQAIPAPETISARAGTVQFVSGRLVGNAVKNSPYSADSVVESTQTLADGNKIVNRSSTKQFRDSEGRERHEMSLGPDAAMQMVMISDPISGVNYSLNTASKTAEKMPGPVMGGIAGVAGGLGEPFAIAGIPGEVGFQPAQRTVFAATTRIETRNAAGIATPQETAAEENLGAKTIEGVMATGTRRKMTIAAGKIGNERPIDIVTETWYSPDLKMTVLSETTDPRMGKTVMKLENISRSEPSRSLFEVPPGYAVSEGPGPQRLRVIRGDPQKQ